MDEVGITVNKNAIPFDELPPTKTSGIRIGTPAITTRGFKADDAKEVAHLIIKVAENQENDAALNEIKEEVRALTARIPLYK